MKKTVKILALLMALLMSISVLVACGDGGKNNGDGEGNGISDVEVDASKSQLYVFAINNGFKVQWLNSAIRKYEELNANVSWEEGKMGVQVIPYTPVSYPSVAQVAGDPSQDIWFLGDRASMRSYKNGGAAADITEILTAQNPYEDEGSRYPTILSRFDEGAKESLSVDGKYYCIPSQHGSYNFVYNRELFDKYDWYFTTDGKLRLGNAGTLGSGPNGISGDYDDGLPATYDQFYMLCDQIAADQKVAISWPGAHYKMFLEGILHSLFADYTGYEDMCNYFNFTGDHFLAKIENGEVKLDSASTSITVNNASYVFQQPGLYYAIEFVYKLVNTPNWQNPEAFDTSYRMTEGQDDFILSGVDGETLERAIMIEGDWWMQEAYATFDDYEDEYGSETDRDFRVMPMPKATEDKIGEPITVLDEACYNVIVSANIDESKFDLAGDFLQFMYSSEQLAEYTKITNTLVPVNYDIPDDVYDQLPPYTQSLIDVKRSEGATFARFLSTSEVYFKNEAILKSNSYYFTNVNGTRYGVIEAMVRYAEIGATPQNIFKGFYEDKASGLQ